jgi:hypothetical protein
VKPAPRYADYSTRHMRVDLLDRLRTLAVLSKPRKSMEEMLTAALEAGLDVLEPTIIGVRKAK